MKTALTILALLALAGSATAGGTEQFTWVLPHGADANALAVRMQRDQDLWPEGEDAKAWAHALAHVKQVSTRANRIGLWIDVPENADVEVLDHFVAACYHQYQVERLPTLPALIELNRMERRAEERDAESIRAEMYVLLMSGAGVVTRDETLAASATRSEDLRRRIVDARIEAAVLEARIRAVRVQVMARKERLVAIRTERLAAMEADLERRIKQQELSPSSRTQGEHREKIEQFRRQPIPDDDLLDDLLRKAADLEVEQIGKEELVKVLGKSLEEEKQRSLKLLDARSLEEFRRSRLAPVEKRIRELKAKGTALEKELVAVRSLQTVRRVTVDPESGEFPRYFVVGAVQAPGTHMVTGKVTLTQLIAKAGDFHPDADERRIRILRREGARTLLLKIDFIDILGLKVEDPELRPGDLVSVPHEDDPRDGLPKAVVDPETGEKQHVYVWGAATGAFVLEEGMRISRLLRVIGDVRGVDLTSVKIIRKSKTGKSFSIPVDAEEVNVRKPDPAKDLILQPNDVIYLPEKK